MVIQNWNSRGYNIDADIGFDELRMAKPKHADEEVSELEMTEVMDQVARSMRFSVRARWTRPAADWN